MVTVASVVAIGNGAVVNGDSGRPEVVSPRLPLGRRSDVAEVKPENNLFTCLSGVTSHLYRAQSCAMVRYGKGTKYTHSLTQKCNSTKRKSSV